MAGRLFPRSDGSRPKEMPPWKADGWRDVEPADEERSAPQSSGSAPGAVAGQEASGWREVEPAPAWNEVPAQPAPQGAYVHGQTVHVAGRQWQRADVRGAHIESRRTGHVWGVLGFIITVTLGVLLTETWDVVPTGVGRPFFAAPMIGSLILAFRGWNVQELVLDTVQGRVVAARHNGTEIPGEWHQVVQGLQ